MATGKVRVLRAGGGLTLVRIEGDHAVYAVSDAEDGTLRCECKAAHYRLRCSHVIAAEMVTMDVAPPGGPTVAHAGDPSPGT